MKHSQWSKLLSLFLVLAMLVQMMPVMSLADDDDLPSFSETAPESAVVTVMGEVEELREENVKHFRLSDGTFVAVNYGMAVHYEDSDGNWQDIDNTISQSAATQTFNLERDDAIVSFASSLTNGKVLTTSKGDASITMTLLDSDEVMRMLNGEDETTDETEPEETEATESEATEPETTESEVTEPETTEPETTEPEVTEPEETQPETEPEDVPTESTEPENTESEELESESVDVEEKSSEDVALYTAEDNSDEYEVAGDSLVEDVPDETTGETNAEAGDGEEETTAPAETEVTEPESTAPETEPEITEPEETEPETTVADETEPETTEATEPELEESTDPGETDVLKYDRNASASIVESNSSLVDLQKSTAWNVEDVIPKKLQSSLIYKNVFPDTDLLYTAYGYNLKEQIVVNSQQTGYSYNFLLNLDGLTAKKNEDGSISFLDKEGTPVYEIPVPYMEDNAGVISEDVTFTLNETEDGLVLTVEANSEWINDKDRVFPVKIDPSFTIISGKALDEIYSVYTMEAAPNDTTLGRQYLYVGAQPYSTTNDGRYRLFMHFNDMPSIPAGSEVVGASLSLYQHQYVQRNCTSFPIGVYEVTTDLPSKYSDYYNWFAAMTWRNNMPEYDSSNAIDYVMVDSTKGYRDWNITELVKMWYADKTSNTTCALVMMNESDIDTYTYYASAAFYAYAGSIPPVMIVSYRDNTGIEPYYTYATLGAASAGTAYIADATGQLKVGKELASYASTVNPFSLNLIYNSDYFSLSSGTDYQPPSKLGLSMTVGSGWTLDYIQKVVPETISGIQYLRYTDGDGTVHYFIKDSSPKDSSYPYYDEDGLGLKMKVNSTNNYTMADDNGNTWTFTKNYLTTVKDETGNVIKITYTSGRITKIVQTNKSQTSITLATFAYSGNALSTVTDNAGNVYTLVYADGKLTSIQKNGTTIAQYEYSGYRLAKMTDSESSYSLAFTYVSGKVSSYKELGGSTTGATVAISYPNQGRTTYRDYGQDRKPNTSDDILTHYLFDYARRTVNAYTTDNSGVIIGATNAAYYERSSTDKTNDKRNNRTIRTASIGLASQQLLKNTSIESSSDAWTFSGASRSTTKPRTGKYSIKGTQTSNGTQYAMKSSEKLTAGKKYTFSAYVNTSEVTKFEGSGVCLLVTDGSKSWTSNYVNYTTSNTVDDGWVRISVSFTAPSTDVYGITIFNSGCIGTFYADDVQVEEAEAPSSYNLLENGSMETSSYGWTMGSGASYYSGKGVASSTKSIRIVGNPTDQGTNAYQDVALNLPGTQTYVLSGWVNANAVPDDDQNTSSDLADRSKECGLRAIITYSDNKTETQYVPFNSDLSNTWQFVSMTVVPKESTKTVSKIRVMCAYEGNANTAYFDNISLIRESAQTMKYDSDGNLVSVTTSGLKEDTSTYANGNLIKTVTGGNGTYKYTYSSTYKHRLTSVTNDQIKQSMTYDTAGNAITTKLTGSGSKIISTSATYGGSLNRLASTTDAAGTKVTYGYGTKNAQMMALATTITDAYGVKTNTEYDDSYRAVQTSVADYATLVYNYVNGNLGSIERTDDANVAQTYSFTYDSFGNMTALKVGSKTLATCTYGSENGLLQKQSFANGDSISFTYDKLGRTKTATYSDGTVLTYVYNGEGNLHSMTETKGDSSTTYLYNYDSIGRLINSEKQVDGSSVIHNHDVFNTYNQLVKESWQVGGDAYTQTSTYNSADGTLDTFSVEQNGTELAKFTMGYDGLRRLSTVTGAPYVKGYTYRDTTGSNTTTQVSAVDYSRTTYGNTYKFVSYSYTYDKAGNILTATDQTGNVIKFTYDDRGQLLTESGTVMTFGEAPYPYSNVFKYDTVGNIKSVSDGTTTHTYAYEDADWKDLLTAYDGESITYDSNGNPTSYFNGNRWTFGWSNGRQLTTLSKQAPVIITTQPENFFGTTGGIATFTVKAEGDRVTYQWQRSKDEGKTWTDISGETSETLRVTIQSGDFGNQYRCIAKDFMGHIATSQAGKLASSIASQSALDPEYTVINEPDDYYGRPGDIATFIVEAEGKNLSYQWLYQAPGSDEFVYCTSSDATTNTLRVEMTAESDGAQYRCFITDANGDMGSTRCATVKLDVRDWTMEYEAGGLRTKRSSAEKTYNYIYSGDKLVRMTCGDNILDFTYDANGAPLTLVTGGKVYYYLTNLQGDVISVESSDGTPVAGYCYDAWGKILSSSGDLAELNPLRYRGYVYDQETGFYYVESRYYDPAIRRFINADSTPSTGQDVSGTNMYAYCGNNPVSRKDDGGEFWNIVIGAGVGATVSGLISFASQAMENGLSNVNWARVGVSAAAGAISGGFAATGIKVNGQMAINGIIGAASSGIDTYLQSSGKASLGEYAKNIAVGAGIGLVGGRIGSDGTGTRHLSKSAGQAFKRIGNAVSHVSKSGIRSVAREVLKAGRYYYSQIATQAIRSGRAAITPIITSNILSAVYNFIGALRAS